MVERPRTTVAARARDVARAVAVLRRLLEEIDILWRTGQLRSAQINPLDEVRTVMSVFDETLFPIVPEIYRNLDLSLQPR